jgi:hypothetical protein
MFPKTAEDGATADAPNASADPAAVGIFRRHFAKLAEAAAQHDQVTLHRHLSPH